MRLTKHLHACVVIDEGDRSILIDPGAFTPNAAELIAAAHTILITHEHLDHCNVEALAAALGRPGLTVYAPRAVVTMLTKAAGGSGVATLVAVAAGDEFAVGAIPVRVFGDIHAAIHPDIPRCDNVGYLVGERVFHPGDSVQVPDATVEVLLLPTSGPWYNTGQAIDYVRAVNPRRCIQIHELFASAMGQASLSQRFIHPSALTDVALELVAAGASVEI